MTNTTDRSRLLTVLDNEHMRAVALGDIRAALILQDAMNALAAFMEWDLAPRWDKDEERACHHPN